MDKDTLETVRFVVVFLALLAAIALFGGCAGVRVGGSYCHGDECFTVWTDRPAEGPATSQRVDPKAGRNFGSW